MHMPMFMSIYTRVSRRAHQLSPCYWHRKFNEVPEYKGLFVYKHHAVLHSAQKIPMCGPAIVRTERMFENKLQYIKRRAKASNFRNPIHSVGPTCRSHTCCSCTCSLYLAVTTCPPSSHTFFCLLRSCDHGLCKLPMISLHWHRRANTTYRSRSCVTGV